MSTGWIGLSYLLGLSIMFVLILITLRLNVLISNLVEIRNGLLYETDNHYLDSNKSNGMFYRVRQDVSNIKFDIGEVSKKLSYIEKTLSGDRDIIVVVSEISEHLSHMNNQLHKLSEILLPTQEKDGYE